MFLFTNILGWAGTCLLAAAYFLVSTGRLKSNGITYQLMNLFGAAGLGVNVFYQKAWPAFLFEIIWIAIASYSLFKKKNPMDMSDLIDTKNSSS